VRSTCSMLVRSVTEHAHMPSYLLRQRPHGREGHQGCHSQLDHLECLINCMRSSTLQKHICYGQACYCIAQAEPVTACIAKCADTRHPPVAQFRSMHSLIRSMGSSSSLDYTCVQAAERPGAPMAPGGRRLINFNDCGGGVLPTQRYEGNFTDTLKCWLHAQASSNVGTTPCVARERLGLRTPNFERLTGPAKGAGLLNRDTPMTYERSRLCRAGRQPDASRFEQRQSGLRTTATLDLRHADAWRGVTLGKRMPQLGQRLLSHAGIANVGEWTAADIRASSSFHAVHRLLANWCITVSPSVQHLWGAP
jgi:hypothetical protein